MLRFHWHCIHSWHAGLRRLVPSSPPCPLDDRKQTVNMDHEKPNLWLPFCFCPAWQGIKFHEAFDPHLRDPAMQDFTATIAGPYS
eukprot:NODE_17168_length_958_cov_5.510229.p4 GENE.NODE_17168_length_958_cov_5.510229~~NODE_17168_length_958_cov_5.510229.p4  ORF type:complete len:85 (+),score=11.10 NODE_17168_length_958_cov_5.510229:149-403(+)